MNNHRIQSLNDPNVFADLYCNDISKVTMLKNEFKVEASSVYELMAKWMEFLALKNELELVKEALTDLHKLLQSQNIHIATKNDLERSFILRVYYRYLHLYPTTPRSALLESPDSNIYCIFGGQGPNEEYMIELQYLYDTYPLMLTPLISIAEKTLGLPILSWLQNGHPDVEYTASVPISLPMIGVTQLCQYLVTCRVLNLQPGELRSRCKGAAGHSQGIVSAVAIACSDTMDSFFTNFEKAVRLLQAIGERAQQAFPVTFVDPSIVQDCEEKEGIPSAMLSVVGIDQSLLEKLIAMVNEYNDQKVSISLYNGLKNFVVTGTPKTLYGLVLALRKEKVGDVDQSKVPFSKRKPNFSVRFLPVQVPFHSSYLKGCTDAVLKDVSGLWSQKDLKFPVFHTESGCDISTLDQDITASLCEQIFVKPIHWNKVLSFPATHLVDFGPGGLSGIGAMSARNLDGRGVVNVPLGKEVDLYDAMGFKKSEPWAKFWSPKLVQKSDGTVLIDTALSRLTGKPPIWCCGMTPSTVSGEFVVAVTNSGYSIELAGGGHYNATMLREKVEYIKEHMDAGHGIILNSLYINPRQWTFQYPLWCQLRKEGLPIEGLTVAAGIPSPDVAKEIIKNLKDSGIKYVSFKPGSVDGLRQVSNIAAANPDYPVICQWTGGRAGGHHSYEDFHTPLIATYSQIRQNKNLVLLVGSGFGDAEETYPYLTGEWSLKYGMPLMPTDGLLFGSRLMVAKECKTSLQAKEAIVRASGVSDEAWEGTYAKETGGIITVQSELGEPIHKIATRGVKLWRELDDKVFSLPKEKRMKWLEENKQYIIDRLNKDFQKPWFPKKKNGSIPQHVNIMTYEEVALRMTELMYVKHQERWIHSSHRNLVGEFLLRVEERFMGKLQPSIVVPFEKLNKDPINQISIVFNKYPQGTVQPLNAEDVEYFLYLCQRPGSKPVPFIPVIDARFEVWFKKDSLWQSEDIDAVVDQDVGRVCILQGPVAVRHSKVANEPVKDILDGINFGLIQKFGLEKNDIKCEDAVGATFAPIPLQEVLSYGVDYVEENGTITYTPMKSLDTKVWLRILGGRYKSWLSIFLTFPFVVQGKDFAENPLLRVMKPTPTRISGNAESLVLETIDGILRICKSGNNIHLSLKEKDVVLEFLFQYCPGLGYAPIHEVMSDRNQRIKEFYYKLWFSDVLSIAPSIHDTFVCSGVVDKQTTHAFCSIVGNLSPSYRNSSLAPIDYAIVVGWRAIIKALFAKEIDGDLLQLVHLSNAFKLYENQQLLQIGDKVETKASVTSVKINDSGKVVKVTGVLYRNSVPAMEVVSEFMYRGRYTDYENCFEELRSGPVLVEIVSEKQIAVLRKKDWFQWQDKQYSLQLGSTLVFNVTSKQYYSSSNKIANLECTGKVAIRTTSHGDVEVAVIRSELKNVTGNPVTAYLERNGRSASGFISLPNEYTIKVDSVNPTMKTFLSNQEYAAVSGDTNPIHVNPYFSNYAQLPSTITHGMWTSAATRKYLDVVVAENKPELVKSYSVQFVGMVCPSDKLKVNLYHIGMRDGSKVIRVETVNQNGDKVLVGTADVSQPSTAFVFTGQGSQEQGMGMELYATSDVARNVWDQADKYLQETYSFSIIDIVRNNPKEKTIHFGGFLGQKIRDRYMNMTYDTIDEKGEVKSLALFPDITLKSMSYTFYSPTGLLFSTQFAQIALVVTEKAAFEDLRAKGLVGQCISAFAGHSLGEYAALASVGNFMGINSLCDIVFYRGLTMQRAVERDSKNRSNYAMMAANPSRISATFDETTLRDIVKAVAGTLKGLCEIVNFNVENQQYVVAGELIALATLTNVLNFIKIKRIDVQDIRQKLTPEELKSKFEEIILVCKEQAKEEEVDGFITLKRGFATIPLAGIDIPFHSSHIWRGVGPFRSFISRKIDRTKLNVDLLISKYIPNLTATPFSLEKSYVERIIDCTQSPRLTKVLKDWEKTNWNTPAGRQELGYMILVELLAYQFASPVRWIETQDHLFGTLNIDRFIEIGPSPVLTGMATRTLSSKYMKRDTATGNKTSILCIGKHKDQIYYHFEDVPDQVTPSEVSTESITVQVAPAAEPVVAAPAQVNAVAVAVPDEPVQAMDVLLAIIAQKLKKSPMEIPKSKSIKDLVGGKSTLQNEILGDLQAEFSSAPEKGEELPLEELGSALGYSGTLGKHMSTMISRLISQKFPGGFPLSMAHQYLNKTWGLGSGRCDAVMVRGITNEPSSRLGSEADAKVWLDQTAKLYASEHGLTLSQGATSGPGNTNGGPVMNSEEFEKYKSQHEAFVTQHVELYMRYLGKSSRDGNNLYMDEKARTQKLQSELDSISKEHGEKYIKGIQPVFDVRKSRHFDSAWNWVRQDAKLMYYDIIFGRLTEVDREIMAKSIAIINRADPSLLDYIRYHIKSCNVELGETYKHAKELAGILLGNCEQVLTQPPRYKDVTFPTAPSTTINPKGDIQYSEVNRQGVRKLEAYVKEMAAGSRVSYKLNMEKIQQDIANLYEMVKLQPNMSVAGKEHIKSLYDEVVRSLNPVGDASCLIKARRSSSSFISPTVEQPTSVSDNSLPFLHLKRNLTGDWIYSKQLTCVYLDILTEIATSGSSFEGTNALLTGCGRGSIGAEVLKGLLSGGSKVVVTTSSYSRKTVEYYQQIYQVYGSKGSKLVVVPFNQASKQDCDALIDYIYSPQGLNMDLDYVVPFAAISENGREVDGIDDTSELAHRLMLTNLIRLIGSIKTKKQVLGVKTRPTQIVLPQSPNHGLFGGDGLYAESKIGLEPLFNKWKSESWSQYISLVGAVIGWTRGTGLMNSTNILAEGVEKHGVRTFSAKEMGFNILGLMHPILAGINSVEPLWADLSGGMLLLPQLNQIMEDLRKEITQKAEVTAAICKEQVLDEQIIHGTTLIEKPNVQLRANFTFEFPELLSFENLQRKLKLRNKSKYQDFNLSNMIDLEKTVVVVGFAEVGPWGSSRTRWEMEAQGKFSITGCLELARIMGYVKFFNGKLKDGKQYIGWIETSSSQPITDAQVKEKYETTILEHTGIRFIEPELFGGYDPNKKNFIHEVVLNHDLEPVEVSKEEALHFKLKHESKVDIWSENEGAQWFVKFKKGACIMVPKAMAFDRLVAGQIPTGWDAKRYGIPQDIIDQVDPCTLWSLVATAEALASAGITDPYELFKYVHVSEVGNAFGSGLGGAQSLQGIFKSRFMGHDVQKDILQESFINTTAGWINLLLLSASGPVKIPVGACATALQSLEIGVDTIQSGKARVMICGGVDDFTEEGSMEFANMKATSNSLTEIAQGRSPSEMSRPTTSSRAGFMEAQGSGVQVLMQAKLALEMGVPIYGVLGLTNTAMDKQGRSVPAPGQGILTTAKENSQGLSPRLDLDYRRRNLEFRRKQIRDWFEMESRFVKEKASSMDDAVQAEKYATERINLLKMEAARQEQEALDSWGTGFYKNDPSIAPLRGALAVYGLDIDDVGVVSFHGTSTVANDKNESDVTNKQFAHLGRSKGNGCPVIAQKWLTGHPKGAAAAWMTNGLLQTILSGIVPGNRNADNIAPELEKFDHIFYPSRSIQTDGIKAGILKSFGFGQVGGEALLIHPEYLLSSIDKQTYATYVEKNRERWELSYRHLHESMVHENLIKVKEAAPYTSDIETAVYLNPLARAVQDHKGQYSFVPPQA